MKKGYFLFLMSFFVAYIISAQENKSSKATETGKATFLGVVPSLASQLKNGTIKYGSSKTGELNKKIRLKSWGAPTGKEIQPKTVYQNAQTEKGAIQRAPMLDFEAHVVSTFAPSDPTGAVGPSYYISAINGAEYSIWNLDGSAVAGFSGINMTTLWAGETLGDPIVFYDTIHQRYVITQFSNSPNGFLVAVCQGSDPLNDGWYTYRFNTTNPASFPDYPKFSVWSDGYYITANKDQGSPTTSEVVYVLESDKMAWGETTQYAGFPLSGIGINGFYSPAAANIQGYDVPPTGKCPIIYMQDNNWASVSGEDTLKIWEVDMDWVTITSSTITQTQNLGSADGVTAFDNLFDNGSFANIPQPGGGDIDALQGTMNYMTNYRMFPTHNSMVMNFVVDMDGNDDLAGIRWYELRQTAHGQPWTVYQEGTYAPSDGRSRWSGSIAMDGDGNIGLGFTSVRDAVGTVNDENPSLRYTGRLAGDPLGTMTVAEDIIKAGTGPEGAGRYGDYSQLTLDPTDNRTFWFIGEVFDASRKSHVGKFQLDAAPAITVGVFDLLLQAPTLVGSATETISVTLENYGTTSQGNFPVKYTINGGATVTETFTGTLSAGAQTVFNFATTADMSTPGLYSVDVRTALATDTFPADDGFTLEVKAVLQNDLAAVAISAPVTGTLTAVETVTITIENFGSNAQSNFPVQYTIDGGAPVIETYTGSIAAGASANYNFTATGDFSSGGSHAICAKVNLASDQNISNDEFCSNVANVNCVPSSTNASAAPAGCNADGIKQFILGTITADDGGGGCNTEPASSPKGYADRTGMSTDLDRVTGLNVHVLQTMHLWAAAPANAEQISVWIDFNDDGDFTDAGEQLLSGGTFAASGALESFNLTIPTTANLGSHVLRAICVDTTSAPNDINDPCADFVYGECQDYTVNIVDSVLSVEDDIIEGSNFNVNYLGANQFNVELVTNQSIGNLNLTVYNTIGQKIVASPVSFGNGRYTYNLNLSNQASGVYIVNIGNDKTNRAKKIVVQ